MMQSAVGMGDVPGKVVDNPPCRWGTNDLDVVAELEQLPDRVKFVVADGDRHAGVLVGVADRPEPGTKDPASEVDAVGVEQRSDSHPLT